MIIENFKDDKEALRAMTGELVRYMDRKDDGLPFNLALSGGGTAQKMFALWVDEYKDKMFGRFLQQTDYPYPTGREHHAEVWSENAGSRFHGEAGGYGFSL